MAQDVIAEQVGRLAFQVDDAGLRQFNASMDQAKRGSDAFGSKAVALGTVVGNLATQAAGLAIELGRAAYTAGKEAVVNFAETGTELGRMSQRVDLSVEALQRWQAAGRRAGMEAEQSTKAVEVFNKGLAELALTGGGPAKDALGLLGLTMEDLGATDTEGDLMIVADALRAIEDPSERSMIAMRLFGEEAGALAPVLAGGADGLKAIGDAAEQAGTVMSGRAVEQAQALKRALGDIDRTSQALELTFVQAVAPAVTEIAQGFGAWYRENEQLLAQQIPAMVAQIVESGGALVQWVTELGDRMGNLRAVLVGAGEEGGGAMAYLVDVAGTLVEWSKAGIETFVDWADAVAGLAAEVWDIADALGDGLMAAYEAVEPVVDTVTDAIGESVGRLDGLVEFVETLVDRMMGVQEIVHGVAEELGLTRAIKPVELPEAIAKQRDAARREAAEEHAYQDRVAKHAERLIAEADQAEHDRERRRKGAGYSKGLRDKAAGVKAGVDTRRAEALLGDAIEDLGDASGATPKARRKALEAAAKALQDGSSQSVALQAATSALSGSTGVDLSAQGGPEAALFGQLTKIGGAEAARAATDGARFVNIDQSQTNNITVTVPESWGQALTPEGAADVFVGSVREFLTGEYRKIVDRAQGSMSP